MNNVLIAMTVLAAGLIPAAVPRDRADIEAKVVFVDTKNNLIVIDKGKKAGRGADYEYDVVRKTAEKSETIGSGTFEKFIGQESMSKLLVDDKTAAAVKIEDTVLCRRKG
jgi:hypothetical protein